MIDSFWLQGMLGSVRGAYECVAQFSETDFTGDLRRFDVPTLVLHGDDDQIVPIADAALKTVADRAPTPSSRSSRAPRTACA